MTHPADPSVSRPVEWTEIGWIEKDSANVGFGDDACRSRLGDPLLDLYLRAGQLLGARICLTTDVDDLEGTWQPAGAIPVTSASCLAADPFIDHEIYRRSFDCPNGLFPVGVFEWPDPEEGGRVDWLGSGSASRTLGARAPRHHDRERAVPQEAAADLDLVQRGLQACDVGR
jgi:hypothetical protein